MKGKMVFGALLVSVALISQGFGMDLLGHMRGLNCGGCGACTACAAPACAPCAKACAPEPACKAACDPCARRCDLFAGLKDLFACRKCGKVRCGCEPACKACEPAKACAPVKACEPACKPCAPVKACEPACKACEPACEKPCHKARKVAHCDRPACKACEPACAKPAACEAGCEKPRCHQRVINIHKDECGPNCRPKLGHGLVLSVLDDIFACKRCEKKDGCGEPGCCAVVGTGGGAPVAPAPAAAPAKPGEEAAPLPVAPKADPSASLMRPRSIYQANRSLVQK